MKEDLYKILELKSDCTTDDIKKSFRRLAKLYHPDKTSSTGRGVDTADKFKLINEAYSTLVNPEKRTNYDYSHNLSINPIQMNVFFNMSSSATTTSPPGGRVQVKEYFENNKKIRKTIIITTKQNGSTSILEKIEIIG